MNVITMVEESLKEKGFGGLFNDECGCELSDLAPCEGMRNDCIAGYKHHHRSGAFVISTQKAAMTDEQIETIIDCY